MASHGASGGGGDTFSGEWKFLILNFFFSKIK